ncbi:hypothetical protein DDB_G0269806 [Dictyostelium discoideum AX4]|uniref:Uncharacterized protein n=1 Tax=Dictyostelium discoideum TaxID=44689 RepID=Q55D24_DICDI|nr:hypothetical protein DDB_G0269806 [Dictyostelium discoideum AX4]EAL72253.1 hypothetical protein DDB_G0269806 [Dictyostelium discoideum AX4]|eukprot:XP_646307.1 hypothetical protein DDB_G0269806 [Dictyostelium discoideum AX4]
MAISFKKLDQILKNAWVLYSLKHQEKIIDNLIRCDKASIFAKPSEDDKSYVPPNQNQRELIKEMINSLSYVSLPDNLFQFHLIHNLLDFHLW